MKTPHKLYEIYKKHVEFGLLSQADRNKAFADLALTQCAASKTFNWVDCRMCLSCFSVAFGMSAKRLQEKITLSQQGELPFDMKLKLAGPRLVRKVGTGARGCTKADRFLGHLEDLCKNQAEKNPKGDDYFLPPPGKTERIEE